MPLTHESVVYGVTDFKVAKLLTDPSSGSPTYGASVDVPGIDSVSLDPNLITAELKGDGKVIAKKGSIDKFGFSSTYGKLSLDALAAFVGGTVTDAGVTPNQTSKWVINGKNSLPYFKASFQILDTDIGDIVVVAHKCQVTGGSLLSQSTDNFGQPTIDFDAFPTNANDALFVDITFNETATTLT